MVARSSLEEGVGLGEVLAVGPLALEEVGHGVAAEPVHAHAQPEAHDVEHLFLDRGVVVVEVGLVAEEAVPVVLLGHRVPRPVGALGVGEDDPRALVALVGVAPDVPVAAGVFGAAPRLLEPGVLVAGVVHHQLGEDPDSPGMRGVDQLLEVLHRPVVGVDGVEVGNVVAVVAERAGVHREQPEAVHPQVLEVGELGDQALDVALPVAVGVEEGADVELVDDGRLEPQGIVGGHRSVRPQRK